MGNKLNKMSFKKGFLALAVGATLCGGAFAADKTVVTLSRFFGSCEAQFGKITDISKSSGECGIITAMTNKFNADNPHIEVKTQVVEWTPYYDQLSARIVAKDIPAIAVMHEANLGDFVRRGLVEPLDDGFKAVGVDTSDFTPHAKRGVTFDSKTYALPFDTHSWLWHMNLNLLKKAGLTHPDGTAMIPKTPEETYEFAKKFKAATGKPYFIWCLTNETAAYTRTFLTLLYQQGGNPFPKSEREINLHTPEAKKAIEFMAKLYAEGHIVPNNDYGASIQSFMRGDGGVMVNGTWLIGDLVDQSALAGAPLEKGYQAIPFANLYGKPATWADGHSWVMLKGGTKDEKTKQAALRYLKFLSDNNGEWARTGQLPTSQKVISGTAFNALPFRTSIGVIAQNGISLPPTIARQFRIQELLGEALGSIMLSKKPVDETIKATEKRINKMLAGVK